MGDMHFLHRSENAVTRRKYGKNWASLCVAFQRFSGEIAPWTCGYVAAGKVGVEFALRPQGLADVRLSC